jgi:hypothetical protein
MLTESESKDRHQLAFDRIGLEGQLTLLHRVQALDDSDIVTSFYTSYLAFFFQDIGLRV